MPLNKDKLAKKLESHHRPENLDPSKVKNATQKSGMKCFSLKPDLQISRSQNSNFFSKVPDTLINLKSNKYLSLDIV